MRFKPLALVALGVPAVLGAQSIDTLSLVGRSSINFGIGLTGQSSASAGVGGRRRPHHRRAWLARLLSLDSSGSRAHRERCVTQRGSNGLGRPRAHERHHARAVRCELLAARARGVVDAAAVRRSRGGPVLPFGCRRQRVRRSQRPRSNPSPACARRSARTGSSRGTFSSRSKATTTRSASSARRMKPRRIPAASASRSGSDSTGAAASALGIPNTEEGNTRVVGRSR